MNLPQLDFRDLAVDVFECALHEDIGCGDITTNALPLEDVEGCATLIAREEGVLAGVALLPHIREISVLGRSLKVDCHKSDGEKVKPGDVIAKLTGPARTLLVLERSLLNILSHLSGIATMTARFVERVRESNTKICDTRKTLPGLRVLEKYAVACGGGTPHRMGLFDEAMIKENYLSLSGISIAEAVEKIRSSIGNKRLTCEVENLDQLREVLQTQVDCILLDEFSTDDIQEAVEEREKHLVRRVSRRHHLGVLLGHVGLGHVPDVHATRAARV